MSARNGARYLSVCLLLVATSACGDDDPAGSGGSGGSGAGTNGGAGGTGNSNGGGQGGGLAGGAGGMGAAGGQGGAGGTGAASPVCEGLCDNLDACGDFPVADCASLCDETIAIFEGDSMACKTAVHDAIACMQTASCEAFPSAALPGGDCDADVQAQLVVCLGPGYFPGWDACASHCEHAIGQCNVDVPNLSTYQSFDDCFYECKLNRSIDYDAGCIEPAIDLFACYGGLSCDDLEDLLNEKPGATTACDAQAAAYNQSCAF